MSPAETALALFAVCNSARVFAYVPQIIAVLRDRNGASAISYTTWGLFAASNLSTLSYAVLALEDWTMAVVFAANTGGCAAILAVTAYKRVEHRPRIGGRSRLATRA